MFYKAFQNTRISALGMGCMRFPVDDGNDAKINRIQAQKIIDAAMEGGITYYDTAYIYHAGNSESFLGDALGRYPRESYQLATKFYVAANPDIASVFEEQLRRCKTEYFDFYLLHSVSEEYAPQFMDEQKNYLGYLLEQKEKGRIRYLGFSSHAHPELLTRFLKWYNGFDMAQIQLNYLDWSLLDAKQQYEIISSYNIPIWVMEPLKGGTLCNLVPEAAAILQKAAPKRSLASWAFRYLMGLTHVQTILSGMSDLEQLADNLATFEQPAPLNEDEQKALQQALEIMLKNLGVPCTGCRYCCPVCPVKLNIPYILKGYNEQKLTGDAWRLDGLAAMPHGAADCLHCGACSKRCPQQIDIPGVMRKIAAG